MIIRRAKKEESKALTKLYCKIWPKEIPKRVKAYFSEKIKNKEIFVVIENKQMIGIVSFTKAWWRGADYLDEVVVDERYRGKGIATKLIKTFEKDARKRKARRIFSSTQPSNKASIKMQQKLGYKRCGFVDDMFEEGQKEIIFSKKL